MNMFSEFEFFLRLPLQNIIKTDTGYRFSCPFCNEGNSPWKRRCQLLNTKGHNTIYCFNCGVSTSIKNMVQMCFPYLFEEYKEKEKKVFIENLKKGTTHQKIQNIKSEININTPLQYQFKLNTKYFKPAKEFKEAVVFCKRRKIEDHLEELKYCVHQKLACSGMIIFPFLMEDKETLYGFVGRRLDIKRFHLHSPNDSFKVYNIFGIDKSKPIIAVESQIDSMCIDNAIAMMGADLSFKVRDILKDSELILAFDGDSTGIKKAVKYSEQGHKVFVWPDMKVKDFGDLAEQGWSKSKITSFIKENTYTGIEAKTRLTFIQMRKRK